jgi:hypothetical protein
MKKNKPQETSNNPAQLTATNRIESPRYAETEGNNRHGRKDPNTTTNILLKNDKHVATKSYNWIHS